MLLNGLFVTGVLEPETPLDVPEVFKITLAAAVCPVELVRDVPVFFGPAGLEL